MMKRLELTSADNPRVKSVVKLREHRARKETGLFVAEGEREIARAAQAGLTLVEVYDCQPLTRSRFWSWEKMIPDAQARGQARWYDVTEPLLRKMAYKDKPEGAVAVFEQPRWDWEALAAATQTVRQTARQAGGKAAGQLEDAREGGALYLVAVGLEKPGNLGAMARSAAAAGADALLVADGVVDAFNPNAIRASTGAVFSLPILSGTSERVQQFLARQEVQVYAASPDATQSCWQVDMTKPCALVIGAEDVGLDESWLASGTGVTIPMETRMVDSLNASIAAGVLLFEAARQRNVRA